MNNRKSRLPKPEPAQNPLLKHPREFLEQAFRDVVALGLQGVSLNGQSFGLAVWSEYPIEMLVENDRIESGSGGVPHQIVRVKGLYKTPTEIGHNTFVPLGVDFVRELPHDSPGNPSWSRPLLECYWQVSKIRFYESHTGRMSTIDFSE